MRGNTQPVGGGKQSGRAGSAAGPMATGRLAISESCPRCPHFDPFHDASRHPLHQEVVRELTDGTAECGLYGSVRASAMRNLADDHR